MAMGQDPVPPVNIPHLPQNGAIGYAPWPHHLRADHPHKWQVVYKKALASGARAVEL